MDQKRLARIKDLLEDYYDEYMEAMVDWETYVVQPNLRVIGELQPLMGYIKAYVTGGAEDKLEAAELQFKAGIIGYRSALLRETLVRFKRILVKAESAGHLTERECDTISDLRTVLADLRDLTEKRFDLTGSGWKNAKEEYTSAFARLHAAHTRLANMFTELGNRSAGRRATK